MLDNMKFISAELLRTRDELIAEGYDPDYLKREYDDTVDAATKGVVDPVEMNCPEEMVGCWFDYARGAYIGEAVISFAAQFQGFDPDETSRRAYDDKYTAEFTRAEDFMNEHIARPEGTTFGMSHSGDWGLWRDDEKSEG